MRPTCEITKATPSGPSVLAETSCWCASKIALTCSPAEQAALQLVRHEGRRRAHRVAVDAPGLGQPARDLVEHLDVDAAAQLGQRGHGRVDDLARDVARAVLGQHAAVQVDAVTRGPGPRQHRTRAPTPSRSCGRSARWSASTRRPAARAARPWRPRRRAGPRARTAPRCAAQPAARHALAQALQEMDGRVVACRPSEAGADGAADGQVVFDQHQPAPLVEGGAGCEMPSADAIADLRQPCPRHRSAGRRAGR